MVDDYGLRAQKIVELDMKKRPLAHEHDQKNSRKTQGRQKKKKRLTLRRHIFLRLLRPSPTALCRSSACLASLGLGLGRLRALLLRSTRLRPLLRSTSLLSSALLGPTSRLGLPSGRGMGGKRTRPRRREETGTCRDQRSRGRGRIRGHISNIGSLRPSGGGKGTSRSISRLSSERAAHSNARAAQEREHVRRGSRVGEHWQRE